MRVKGKIISATSKLPLKGVDIYLMSSDGYCMPLACTDALGNFQVQTPDSVSKLAFALAGYSSLLVEPGFLDEHTVQLMPNNAAGCNGSAQPASGISGALGSIPTWVWIAGGGALLLAGSGKKKVGAIDFSSYILPVGLLVGGYFVFTKFFGSGGPSNQQQQTQTNASAVQASLQKQQAAGETPTLTQAQAASFANDIFTKGTLSTPDQAGIENDLLQVINLSDLLLIIQAFGTKSINTGSFLNACAVAKIDCSAVDLGSFLKAVLDADHINSLNSYWSLQNINYQL